MEEKGERRGKEGVLLLRGGEGKGGEGRERDKRGGKGEYARGLAPLSEILNTPLNVHVCHCQYAVIYISIRLTYAVKITTSPVRTPNSAEFLNSHRELVES